jgi:hypothetical protein
VIVHNLDIRRVCSTPYEADPPLVVDRNPLEGLQLLFRVEREFDHPLKQLIGRQAREIPKHQLLHVEAD